MIYKNNSLGEEDSEESEDSVQSVRENSSLRWKFKWEDTNFTHN